MPEVIQGNRREIPGIPPMLWWDTVREYEAQDLSWFPWHHPWLELLTPRELRRMRAKALVWMEVTGEWPGEIAWWWEIRLARRRGDIPHMAERVLGERRDGMTVCGFCGARWSDEEPPERCKLCDRLIHLEG